jgi:CRISPR-associated protein Cas6
MFWQEDNTESEFQVPDDMVDVLFSINCKRLPVDHAYALSTALQRAVPWIGESDSGVGVHTVHVAGSQNGWERPEHGTGAYLILSKRTKLTIRVPRARAQALLRDLQGKALDLSDCPLAVGPGKIRPLSKETTLISRYVVSPLNEATRADREDVECTRAAPTGIRSAGFQPNDHSARATPENMSRGRRDRFPHPNPLPEGGGVVERATRDFHRNDTEEAFLEWAVRTLKDQRIQVRKALCGKTTPLSTPGGVLQTRSLMLADLSHEESVHLQQQGLGLHRGMGCGIFIPHKGIEAVAKGS